MERDEFYCTLGLVAKLDFAKAEAVARFIEEQGGRVIYRIVRPYWEKVWVKTESPEHEHDKERPR